MVYHEKLLLILLRDDKVHPVRYLQILNRVEILPTNFWQNSIFVALPA